MDGNQNYLELLDEAIEEENITRSRDEFRRDFVAYLYAAENEVGDDIDIESIIRDL